MDTDGLPFNHHSKFKPEWWNERRRRDYYIDKDGFVQLDPTSPTGRKLSVALRAAVVAESIEATHH